MKITHAAAIATLAASAGIASAQSSNFDSFAEGFYGQTFTFDGITFSDTNNLNGVNPDGQAFTPADIGTELIIEDSTYIYNDFPTVISPFNTLTFGRAYVNGPNLSLGALCTVTFTAGVDVSEASFDLIYLDELVWEGILVTLEAFDDGQVVATESFVITSHNPGDRRDIVDWRRWTMSGVTFDTLRLSATLNGTPTTFRALLDDVEFVTGGPTCPADWDGSGGVDGDDIGAFFIDWQAGDADIDESGGTDGDDITYFFGRWETGC